MVSNCLRLLRALHSFDNCDVHSTLPSVVNQQSSGRELGAQSAELRQVDNATLSGQPGNIIRRPQSVLKTTARSTFNGHDHISLQHCIVLPTWKPGDNSAHQLILV